MRLNSKNKLVLMVTTVGLILIYIFGQGFGSESLNSLGLTNRSSKSGSSSASTDNNSQKKPEVISSSPLFGEDPIVILPSQVIEITFNVPFENTGEVKYRLDPPISDLKVELSSDRMTVKFTPLTPLKLGTTYTLSILPDSKFNINPGKQETKIVLDHNFDFHFKTLEYRGI